MKALIICPSHRPAVPHLAAFGPLATAPVLGDCTVGHWIEHLAAMGAREITVVSTDGGDRVSAAVGDGARWGVRITVVSSNTEPTREEAAALYRKDGGQGWLPAPLDIVAMSHLPGSPGLPLFESYASWYAAVIAWAPMALTPSRVRVKEVRPAVWVGSRSRVSPSATLIGPCWVGDQVSVEAGALVGPGVILEDRTVVGRNALVAQSWVGPDTSVGAMTSVSNSLAWGSSLIDWRTDSFLHVPDPFLLCSLAKAATPVSTDRFGRALAAKETSGAKHGMIAALHTPMGSVASNMKLPG